MQWAKKNPTDYYTKVWVKLAPLQFVGQVKVDHEHEFDGAARNPITRDPTTRVHIATVRSVGSYIFREKLLGHFPSLLRHFDVSHCMVSSHRSSPRLTYRKLSALPRTKSAGLSGSMLTMTNYGRRIKGANVLNFPSRVRRVRSK